MNTKSLQEERAKRKWCKAVMAHRNIASTAKLVLLFLCEKADPTRNDEAWPTEQTIADAVGHSLNTVRYHIAHLVDQSLIEILTGKDRTSPKSKRGRHYRLPSLVDLLSFEQARPRTVSSEKQKRFRKEDKTSGGQEDLSDVKTSNRQEVLNDPKTSRNPTVKNEVKTSNGLDTSIVIKDTPAEETSGDAAQAAAPKAENSNSEAHAFALERNAREPGGMDDHSEGSASSLAVHNPGGPASYEELEPLCSEPDLCSMPESDAPSPVYHGPGEGDFLHVGDGAFIEIAPEAEASAETPRDHDRLTEDQSAEVDGAYARVAEWVDDNRDLVDRGYECHAAVAGAAPAKVADGDIANLLAPIIACRVGMCLDDARRFAFKKLVADRVPFDADPRKPAVSSTQKDTTHAVAV